MLTAGSEVFKKVLRLAVFCGVSSAFLLSSAGSGKSVQNKAQTVCSEFIFESAPFKECHASTMVELPGGDLFAAWFGGAHEGDSSVAIWVGGVQQDPGRLPLSLRASPVSHVGIPSFFETERTSSGSFTKSGLVPKHGQVPTKRPRMAGVGVLSLICLRDY